MDKKMEGSVTVVLASIPAAVSALPAATVSYVIEPITDSRSHGNASPSDLDNATTPTNMAMAGAMVNTAEDVTVDLTVTLLIPSCLARRSAFIKKNTEYNFEIVCKAFSDTLVTLTIKNEKNKATDYFQKAIELNPKDIFALFHLGNIYQSIGLTNFAVENYKKVLEISPDYSWTYFNLASIAFKNENLEEAKDYLLKTIQYNNQDIEAYKLLTKIF